MVAAARGLVDLPAPAPRRHAAVPGGAARGDGLRRPPLSAPPLPARARRGRDRGAAPVYPLPPRRRRLRGRAADRGRLHGRLGRARRGGARDRGARGREPGLAPPGRDRHARPRLARDRAAARRAGADARRAAPPTPVPEVQRCPRRGRLRRRLRLDPGCGRGDRQLLEPAPPRLPRRGRPVALDRATAHARGDAPGARGRRRGGDLRRVLAAAARTLDRRARRRQLRLAARRGPDLRGRARRRLGRSALSRPLHRPRAHRRARHGSARVAALDDPARPAPGVGGEAGRAADRVPGLPSRDTAPHLLRQLRHRPARAAQAAGSACRRAARRLADAPRGEARRLRRARRRRGRDRGGRHRTGPPVAARAAVRARDPVRDAAELADRAAAHDRCGLPVGRRVEERPRA